MKISDLTKEQKEELEKFGANMVRGISPQTL